MEARLASGLPTSTKTVGMANRGTVPTVVESRPSAAVGHSSAEQLAPRGIAAQSKPAESTSEEAEAGEPGGSTPGFDEAAESAFLAEARERGETVTQRAATEPIEETDSKSLPKLDDLVARIPAEVRDTLEDLFRARFVAVKRIPKKALK